jgi:hypothetical protein
MNGQEGQSMTEMAAGLAAMALMLLGSITIAGYQEVQRRMTIAARQATFQGAWLAARDDRSAVVRRAAEFHLEDPAVVDAFGHAYVSAPHLAVAASLQPAPARARAAARALVEPLRATGGFLGGDFDLSADGLMAGDIALNIQSNPRLLQPFVAMSVELRQPFALMTDAWNAAGVSQVRSRTSGLVPTTALSGLQALWRPLLAPLALIEPSLAQLCLGIIEPDRVPEDRLGPGRTSLPGRCP